MDAALGEVGICTRCLNHVRRFKPPSVDAVWPEVEVIGDLDQKQRE